MLLEAPSNDTSRTMAPVLEAAFPTGSKVKIEKTKETERSFGSEVPLFRGRPISTPWSNKVTPGNTLTSKSRMYAPVSMPGVTRCLPERPEPVYPPSYKMASLSPSSPDSPHLSPRLHTQKPEYPDSKHHVVPRSHQMELPVHRAEPPPSSMSMRTPTSSGMTSSTPSPAAFFQGGFPPVSGFPPGAPPYMGMPHHHPHRPPHPHPVGAGHHFPGGAVSAAGFMSLAHILFQPKYPIGKKTFQCHECRYITDRKNNLKRHIATMHQDCGKFLECCDVIFRSKAALRDHVLLYHRTGYKCRFCGRNFCRKALLKRHLAVHNGQKEYICEVCDYATSHKSNLERHRKVHGLGSPLGSDDGDQFLQDGPDAEGYVSNFQVLPSPPDDSLDASMSDEDRDIDVETTAIGEDDDRYRMSYDQMGPSPTAYPFASTIPTDDAAPVDPKPEMIQNDPLLQAFPINLVINKKSLTGKKYKSKLYFSDRLRQTHDADDDCVDMGSHPDKSKSDGCLPTNITPRNDNTIKSDTNEFPHVRSYEDARVQIETETEIPGVGRQSGDEGGEGKSSNPPRPDIAVPRDGSSLSIPSAIPDKVTADNLANRMAMATTGCRRLYASPYKCSECGLGLPSQYILLQHSLLCRKVGVEPPRPIQSLAADEGENSGGQGVGETPRRAQIECCTIKTISRTPSEIFSSISSGESAMNLSRKRHGTEENTSELFATHSTPQPAIDMKLNYEIEQSDTERRQEASYKREVEDGPKDYSVRNILRSNSIYFESKTEPSQDNGRFSAIEETLGKEPTVNLEEPGRTLPIKKRSLNHLGK